jgi:hypothetical protein
MINVLAIFVVLLIASCPALASLREIDADRLMMFVVKLLLSAAAISARSALSDATLLKTLVPPRSHPGFEPLQENPQRSLTASCQTAVGLFRRRHVSSSQRLRAVVPQSLQRAAAPVGVVLHLLHIELSEKV